MMLFMHGRSLERSTGGLWPNEVVPGHKVGDYNIFFKMGQWSDYALMDLQMICWHLGQTGTIGLSSAWLSEVCQADGC